MISSCPRHTLAYIVFTSRPGDCQRNIDSTRRGLAWGPLSNPRSGGWRRTEGLGRGRIPAIRAGAKTAASHRSRRCSGDFFDQPDGRAQMMARFHGGDVCATSSFRPESAHRADTGHRCAPAPADGASARMPSGRQCIGRPRRRSHQSVRPEAIRVHAWPAANRLPVAPDPAPGRFRHRLPPAAPWRGSAARIWHWRDAARSRHRHWPCAPG